MGSSGHEQQKRGPMIGTRQLNWRIDGLDVLSTLIMPVPTRKICFFITKAIVFLAEMVSTYENVNNIYGIISCFYSKGEILIIT